MSFLAELKLKKKNLNHTPTMIRYSDGSLCKEDLYLGTNEVVSVGLGYVVDKEPNLNVTEVLQGLLMGSQDVALSESLLKANNVNCVVSLGINVPQFDGIKYIFVEVLDIPEYNITNIFSQCFEVIDSERKKNRVVYVHCNAGVSRSASLVIGYLMKVCQMKFETAYNFVKFKRPSIKPNEGFIKQLLEYEYYLNNDQNM